MKNLLKSFLFSKSDQEKEMSTIVKQRLKQGSLTLVFNVLHGKPTI